MPGPNFCRKCGALADPDLLCPKCGWDIPGERISKDSARSVLKGLASGLVLNICLPGIGAIVAILLYYSLKPDQPGFARGMGYSLPAGGLLVLAISASMF